jgi:hypothetical protein
VTVLSYTNPQMAGVSGLRSLVDTPVVCSGTATLTANGNQPRPTDPVVRWDLGGTQPACFDGVLRHLLVRWPGAAEDVAAALQAGNVVVKAEVVLPYRASEFAPPGDTNWPRPYGYQYRLNFGVNTRWAALTPRWRAQLFPLLRPWAASASTGPTWNAAVKGRVYWDQYGARGAGDCLAAAGRAEVSAANPSGVVDVTALLSDPAYGATLGERLRKLSDCGFRVRKYETWDFRYYGSVPYSWAQGVGVRAVLVGAPELRVTLAPGPAPAGTDPGPPADPPTMPPSGSPTAVLPDSAAVNALADLTSARPPWMTDAEYAGLGRLLDAYYTWGAGSSAGSPKINFTDAAGRPSRPPWVFSLSRNFLRLQLGTARNAGGVWYRDVSDADAYLGAVDYNLTDIPKQWNGFDGPRRLYPLRADPAYLPAFVQEAGVSAWTPWLLPGVPTHRCLHPMYESITLNQNTFLDGYVDTSYQAEANTAADGLGEAWVGNKTFYRYGFNYTQSTQNFNVNSAMGASVGGALLAGPDARYVAREGTACFLRFVLGQFQQGFSQENYDHYYFPFTFLFLKFLVDAAYDRYTRVLAKAAMYKCMDELTGAWHPNLARPTASCSRTTFEYTLGQMGGGNYLMEVLAGTGLHDEDRTLPGGWSLFGGNSPAPDDFAQATWAGRWCPAWFVAKALPFTATAVVWGVQTTHHGVNFGLGTDSFGTRRLDNLATWRRDAADARPDYDQVVVLNMRYGANASRFQDTGDGTIAHPGQNAAIQYRNKVVWVANPWNAGDLAAVTPLSSLQASVGIFNYQSPKTWEVYAGGSLVTTLPVTLNAADRVYIKDGATYVMIVPIPATDLGYGRTAVMDIVAGAAETWNGATTQAALVLNNYSLKLAGPMSPTAADRAAFERCAAGFAVEVWDAADFADWAAFVAYADAAAMTSSYDGATNTLSFSYSSGPDTLAGSYAATSGSGGSRQIANPMVNGTPYAPVADRDTPYAKQGWSGTVLAKGGATLTKTSQRTGFLRTGPAGQACALNLDQGFSDFRLDGAAGWTVRARRRVGATVVEVPDAATVLIDTADHPRGSRANTWYFEGFPAEPAVTFNGASVALVAVTGGWKYEFPGDV